MFLYSEVCQTLSLKPTGPTVPNEGSVATRLSEEFKIETYSIYIINILIYECHFVSIYIYIINILM